MEAEKNKTKKLSNLEWWLLAIGLIWVSERIVSVKEVDQAVQRTRKGKAMPNAISDPKSEQSAHSPDERRPQTSRTEDQLRMVMDIFIQHPSQKIFIELVNVAASYANESEQDVVIVTRSET